MASKHVVHIIFSLQTGGAENIMVDMANAQSLYHKVSIIIINNNYDAEMLQKIKSNILIIFLNRKEKSKNPYKIVILNKYLLQLKPNIIHCHNHNAIALLFFYRKHTIYTIHDIGINTKYFKNYKQLIAISKAVYDDIVYRSKGKFKPIIINNGIYIEDIVIKQNFQLHNPIQIIQISRLDHTKKGQDILLHAIAQLLQENKTVPIKISFIGSGSSLAFLQQLTHELKLTDHVEFLLNKTRAWIFEQLHNYDMLIQPSIYEGFGLTILEAMAAQVPVIASNIDGPANIIDNEQYGYLFESKNTSNLAYTIAKLINDYRNNIIEKKVLLARERVKEKYSMQNLLNKYDEVYADLP